MNSNEIKYVQLNLENCEVRVIELKDLWYLYLDDITQEVNYFDTGYQQIFHKNKIAKNVKIGFKTKADKNDLFNRLSKYPDICSIELLDKNLKSKDYYLVSWKDDESQCNNLLQKSKYINDEWLEDQIYEVTINEIYKN